ncbi:Heterokaryon incompatibility protein 6, OR allele [Fusarium oxysporum f. sp. albedinis]|nr:Heterokaryon incompatibility protein 6, OR allele [Fusarium oxysporum f. sp. albedinis]
MHKYINTNRMTKHLASFAHCKLIPYSGISKFVQAIHSLKRRKHRARRSCPLFGMLPLFPRLQCCLLSLLTKSYTAWVEDLD